MDYPSFLLERRKLMAQIIRDGFHQLTSLNWIRDAEQRGRAFLYSVLIV